MAGPGYPRQRWHTDRRVVVPEIDGGMLPLCIATQTKNKHGYYLYTAENERIDAVVDHITKYMSLRDMSNKEKRVAICYFKTPGKDALLASGMEVIPSLYNFLKRLRSWKGTTSVDCLLL